MRMVIAPDSPDLNSSKYSSKFDKYYDFDLWLQGGGRYIRNIFSYLGNIYEPCQTDYNLLQILYVLLGDKVNEIVSTKFGFTALFKNTVKENEITRLRSVQNTLHEFGALSFVVKVLGRVYESKSEDYLWNFTPLAMRFSIRLMSWENTGMQNKIVKMMRTYISKSKPPEFNCSLGLKRIVRMCTEEIEKQFSASNKRDSKKERTIEHSKFLKTAMELFRFIGSICKGGNKKAYNFFSAKIFKSKYLVDIISEVSALSSSIFQIFDSLVIYIKDIDFNNRLAPSVWSENNPSEKRQFLAWHDSNLNLILIVEYAYVISVVCNSLTSMSNINSENSIKSALSSLSPLVKFFGLIDLQATSIVSSGKMSSLLGSTEYKRSITWHGGDPYQFYNLYLRELKEVGAKAHDTVKDWVDDQVKNQRYGKAYFKSVFGISFDLLLEVSKAAEDEILRLITAFYELSENKLFRNEVTHHLKVGYIFQSMDNTFMLSQKTIYIGSTSRQQDYVARTVSYITILRLMGETDQHVESLLENWFLKCESMGYDPKGLYGCIEVVEESKNLSRLYFPVPQFVKKYWSFPEVTLTKEKIVYEVNRANAEEKISDFLEQMERLSFSMERQQVLQTFLTPIVHYFFGGKFILQNYVKYFPSQRLLTLMIAFILNLYVMYFSTHNGNEPFPSDESQYTIFNWQQEAYFVFVLGVVITCSYASLALRAILNSFRANQFFMQIRTSSNIFNMIILIVTLPISLMLVVSDGAWFCVLTLCAIFAIRKTFWLYVPCLFDIVFQFKSMYFLFEAITRNITRIGFTMITTFLILYFFSVIVFLFVAEPYNLGGYDGCSHNSNSNGTDTVFHAYIYLNNNIFNIINRTFWNAG